MFRDTNCQVNKTAANLANIFITNVTAICTSFLFATDNRTICGALKGSLLRGIEFSILDTGSNAPAHEMAEFALKEIGRFCWLTLKEFDECRAQRGAEIGILVIPVADAKDLSGCQKLIDRSRRRGANLSVLVLAQTAQLAEDIILDDCFDAMICIKWASAETKP